MLHVLALVLLALGAAQSPCSAEHLPRFADYPASLTFRGKPKRPVLKSRTDHEYRSMIRQAAQARPNFAGHYAIAQWGCGTGCHGFVVVDVATGVVFDPPFRDLNFHTPPPEIDPGWSCLPADRVMDFRIDSALLVVEGCLDDHQCGRTYYKISPHGLVQVAYDPDRLPNGKIAPY